MDTNTLQKLDRWIGVPLCALASALRKVKGLVQTRRVPVAAPRKILFVKFAEQGSTVIAVPAIRRAIAKVGRENVYFVVFEENRFILDVMDLIPPGNVFPIRKKGIVVSLLETARALGRIRREGIDTAIDMEFFARSSAILALLSGARVRVGFHSLYGEGPYRGDLMTHRVRYNPYLHTSQIFALLVEALDVPAEGLPRFDRMPPAGAEEPASFAAGPEEVAEVERLVMRLTGKATVPPIILLNANASDLLPLRRWEPDRYVELARLILARLPEVVIGFTGAPEEAPVVDVLMTKVGSNRCISFAGETTLRQLLILYGLAEVLVTNDSGPAHFASLTSIHTVTLFGPETPKLFAALTPRNQWLWAGIACSPCVSALNNRQSPCTNNVCMQRITVEQVLEAVLAAYEKRNSPGDGTDAAPSTRPAAKNAKVTEEMAITGT